MAVNSERHPPTNDGPVHQGTPHSNDKAHAAEGNTTHWPVSPAWQQFAETTHRRTGRVMWSYRAQQQSAPHGSVAPFREQPLSWGPTGDKPRGATWSQALPSTGTSLSPCPLRPLSGQTAAPAPTPVSLATAQASGATQAPKDVNLTPAPDLPVTKSSSFEKQKSPWPSPGIQWAATSPLHREAPSLPGRFT